MNWLKQLFCFLLLVIFLPVFSQDTSESKIKMKTPEPGTKLSVFSKMLLKRVNKGMSSNPDSAFLVYDKRTTLRRKAAKVTVDTVISENSIRVRIYIPTKIEEPEKSPVIVFYHGGAYIFGSIDTYHNLAGKICRKSGCIVVLPEYRLAPEFPYPAATNDCYNTLNWVKDNISAFGGDTSKIALMGDSAGGNLTLATSLKDNDNGNSNVVCQVLLYPNTLLTDTLLASRQYFMGHYSQPFVLSEELLRKVKYQYLNGTADTIPYVSPALAQFSNNYPATFIITAQCDPLRDEGVFLFSKLKQANVPVEYSLYKGTIHGFVSFYKVSLKGRKAIRESIGFIQSKF